MTEDSTDSEAPELRKLLDKMHNSESSMYDEDDNNEEDQEINVPTMDKIEVPNNIEGMKPGVAQRGSTAEPTSKASASTQAQIPAGAQPMVIEPSAEQEPTPLRFTPPKDLKHDLEQIPVSLEFCLKTLQKTLGEVSQLQEGEIIVLGGTADGPIELCANGRKFAEGKLVLVENELAVKILKKLE